MSMCSLYEVRVRVHLKAVVYEGKRGITVECVELFSRLSTRTVLGRMPTPSI